MPNEEMTQDEEEELADKFDENLELGQEIVEELIPYALAYYLGIRESEQIPEAGSLSEEEEEDQPEGEGRGAARRGKKGRGGAGPPEAGGKKDGECKQQ